MSTTAAVAGNTGAATPVAYPTCKDLSGNDNFPCNASSIIAVSLGIGGGALSLLFVVCYLIAQVRFIVVFVVVIF